MTPDEVLAVMEAGPIMNPIMFERSAVPILHEALRQAIAERNALKERNSSTHDLLEAARETAEAERKRAEQAEADAKCWQWLRSRINYRDEHRYIPTNGTALDLRVRIWSHESTDFDNDTIDAMVKAAIAREEEKLIDYSELIASLRFVAADADPREDGVTYGLKGFCIRAADAIEAAQKRIAELEALVELGDEAIETSYVAGLREALDVADKLATIENRNVRDAIQALIDGK